MPSASARRKHNQYLFKHRFLFSLSARFLFQLFLPLVVREFYGVKYSLGEVAVVALVTEHDEAVESEERLVLSIIDYHGFGYADELKEFFSYGLHSIRTCGIAAGSGECNHG